MSLQSRSAALTHFLILLLCSACASKPAKAPLDVLDYTPQVGWARSLIVILPGASDVPKDFARQGFIAKLAQRGIAASILGADTHWAYYREHNVVERLREDVIRPAQARGVQRIWLVGFSLGGWGALQYAREHGEDLAGMVLIAPFVGEKKTLLEVKAAGGLAHWRPAVVHPQDDQRVVLAWLRDYRPGETPIDIYLGYGASDAFAPALDMIAAQLRADNVVKVPGGHTWRAWHAAFDALLARGAFR